MGLELGRLVQQRRHELGWSRHELAQQSDVSYAYVSQIETGQRDPSLKTMHKLAGSLSVPVEQLASLVAPETWVGTTSAAAAPSAPPARRSAADTTELYREKVLPSVARKLQSVPPLIRLELLAELTAEAAREAAEGAHD